MRQPNNASVLLLLLLLLLFVVLFVLLLECCCCCCCSCCYQYCCCHCCHCCDCYFCYCSYSLLFALRCSLLALHSRCSLSIATICCLLLNQGSVCCSCSQLSCPNSTNAPTEHDLTSHQITNTELVNMSYGICSVLLLK